LAIGFPFKLTQPDASREAARTESARAFHPSLVYLFYGIEIAVAAALYAQFVPRFEGDIGVLLVLLGLNVLAALKPINIYGNSDISIGFVMTMAIVILFGIPGALIVASVEATVDGVRARRPDYQFSHILHTLAMYAIVYSSTAATYMLLADINPESFAWQMLPATALAAIVAFTMNATLISIETKLRTGQSLREFWWKHAWLAPNYVALFLVGLALAAAYMALGIAGILAFVAPALMIRLSMKQYVEKTKESVAKLEMQNDALRTANIEIRRVSEELRSSYDGTLEALVNALDARDQETKGHSLRVSQYMLDIAREMGVREGTQEWVDMQRGSLLHDVGKIGVSDSILLKPGKLTDEEWTSMRQHPEIGYNMLRQVKFLQGPAELILAHHERWDGRGYPKGLHEDEIPLGARIFSVVDTFDSMTSDRPYRKALTTIVSMNEIMACSGSQFDPVVVEAFLDIYESWVKQREELHMEELEKVA
jgi:putative nucleotidyltransferase with HDIG domain